MRTGVVRVQDIVTEGRRLTGGFHVSEDQRAIATLRRAKGPKSFLRDLVKGRGIFRGPIFSRMFVDDPRHGKPYVSARDIVTADVRPAGYLSRKHGRLLDDLRLQEGMILVTCSGMNLGSVIWTRSVLHDLVASHDLIRIEPDAAVVAPGFLFAFLSSRYGNALIRKQIYGGHIKHIEPAHISSLPVPRLGAGVESRANVFVQRGAQLLAKYQSCIEEATARVFDSTDIWNPSLFDWSTDQSDLGFSVGAKSLDILRAWNHSRRAERIKAQIRSGRWARLGELTSFEWMRWRKLFQRIDTDPEFGVEVITQKPLFDLFPEGRWLSRKYLSEHSPKYWVPDNTILIAKQGTLGEGEVFCRSEFITGARMLARAYSDHCMRVVVLPGVIHPGYLFAFLRSEAAFRLLRSLSEGAKQQDLHWRTVPELPIPRRDRSEEECIGESVLEAYRHRNEAVELLLDAVRLVERAIEGGS